MSICDGSELSSSTAHCTDTYSYCILQCSHEPEHHKLSCYINYVYSNIFVPLSLIYEIANFLLRKAELERKRQKEEEERKKQEAEDKKAAVCSSIFF